MIHVSHKFELELEADEVTISHNHYQLLNEVLSSELEPLYHQEV